MDTNGTEIEGAPVATLDEPAKTEPQTTGRKGKKLWMVIPVRANIRGGRPTMFTEKRVNKILDLIAEGMPMVTAAARCGVCAGTLDFWTGKGKREPRCNYGKFLRQVERAKSKYVQRNLKHISRAAGKDWKAASWSLSKAAPDVFGDRKQVEHSGSIENRNVNVNISVTQTLNAQQAAVLAGVVGVSLHDAPPAVCQPEQESTALIVRQLEAAHDSTPEPRPTA